MSKNSPDYESAIRRRWKKNASDVKRFAAGNGNDAQISNFHQRVDTFRRKFGFKKSDVLAEIEAHPMFRATFATDPRRQNIDENTFGDWLSSLTQTKNVRKLPPSGDNAIFVSQDGYILPGANIPSATRPSKSLDFTWNTGKTTFYAMHKRTTGDAGGAQGTTRKEMESILNNFARCTQRGIALVLVLDGEFWTKERLEELRLITRRSDPKSFAVSSRELVPLVLRNYR